MHRRSKTTLRVLFALLIVVSGLGLGYSYATTAVGDTPAQAANQAYTNDSAQQVVPPRENITVITTDSNTWLGRPSDDPRSKAELVAFAPNGSTLYYNDSYTRYWDVDPVPGTTATVEYMFAEHLNQSQCPTFRSKEYWRTHEYARSVPWNVWKESARAQQKVGACTRNGIARVNLTTGETTRIYSAITPGKHATRWHDGDRINATHYAIADISLDRVFIVNVKTNEITWSWNARNAYSPQNSGGPYPKDWTHINDVEVLPDGRIMASLRNHDQVIFLDPTQPPRKALLKNWTIGADNNHSVLYEQHNPDYIPPKNGGPAVLISDSENNRIVEYQRVNGSWEQTGGWKDARLQWPRDADRLSNGHTLITDTNGDRVVEVNKQGEIVWSVEIGFPYEAERLPSDESTGGASMAQLEATAARDRGLLVTGWLQVKSLLAGPVFSASQYILPKWMGFPELGTVVLILLTVITWGLVETWWATASLRQQLLSITK
jgi:curli biogenesis system outer membrane secretion channel CsgG